MSNSRKKKSPIGILLLVMIIIFGGLGAGIYYYMFHDTQPKESYTIHEKNSEVETQTIIPDGNIGVALDSGTGNGFVPSKRDDETIKNVFETMDNNDAQFFINTKGANGQDLTTVNEEEFIEYIRNDGFKGEPENIASDIGKVLKEFINKNGHATDSEYLQSMTFNGENPKEYYKNRNLEVDCEKVIPTKIWAMGTSLYGVLYKAEITTNNCDGKSVFPKEGRTKNIKIGVIAADFGAGNLDVTLIHVVFL